MIRDQKGQSLTEFALLMPLLFLLICGVIDFGRVLYTYMHMNMASQEAVRLGGLGKGDREITQFSKNYIHIGDPAKLEVLISPSELYRDSGDYVTVTLKYSIDYITPIISQIIPAPYTVQAVSTIRVE
jgi:Flp pilus assembly protein TadG